jgi:phosphoserine phosphatase RsbX
LSDEGDQRSLLDVGAAAAMLPGEQVSGDIHLAESFPGGALVAAIDGLGHGGEAAQAAIRAVSVLEEEPGAPLTTLFERCHARLARTRGVAMSLASFSRVPGELSWLGVGNVEAALVRAGGGTAAPAESIMLLGGVVGYQLPRLRPSTTHVAPGDTVIFATDGVGSGFRHGLDMAGTPQQLADRILAEHTKRNDDALVVVARYLGDGA